MKQKPCPRPQRMICIALEDASALHREYHEEPIQE